jgi:hypothetical protein
MEVSEGVDTMIVYDVKTESRILSRLTYGWAIGVFTAYRDDLDDEENKFRDKKLRELLNAQGLSINRQKSSYTYANLAGSSTKEAMSCFVYGIPLHLCQFIASKRELKAFLYSAKDGPFGLYRTDTGTMVREFPKENNVIELESYLSAYEALLREEVEPDAKLVSLKERLKYVGTKKTNYFDASLWKNGGVPAVKKHKNDILIKVNDVPLSQTFRELQYKIGFLVLPMSFEQVEAPAYTNQHVFDEKLRGPMAFIEGFHKGYLIIQKMGCFEKGTGKLYELSLALLSGEENFLNNVPMKHYADQSFLYRNGETFGLYSGKDGNMIKQFAASFSTVSQRSYVKAILSLVPEGMEFSYLCEDVLGSVNIAMVADGCGIPMDVGWKVLFEKE